MSRKLLGTELQRDHVNLKRHWWCWLCRMHTKFCPHYNSDKANTQQLTASVCHHVYSWFVSASVCHHVYSWFVSASVCHHVYSWFVSHVPSVYSILQRTVLCTTPSDTADLWHKNVNMFVWCTCIFQIFISSSSDKRVPRKSTMFLILSQYWTWSMLPSMPDTASDCQ